MKRLLDAWLWITIPAWARDAARGDLDEERARVQAARGPAAARRWYAREALALGLRYSRSRWQAPPSARSAHGTGTARRPPLAGLPRDVRLAVRQLARRPGVTAAAVATLGIGIGANAAIFSLANAVLLKPIARHEPDRVVRLSGRTGDGHRSAAWTYRDYQTIRQPRGTIGELSAVHLAILAARAGQTRDQLLGEVASAPYFDLLGARAMLGRLPSEADDTPSASPVAVLSERYWRQRFDASPGVLGQPLVLNGRPFTIAGVMEGAFRGSFIGGAIDVWLPLEPALPFLGPVAASDDASARVLQLLGRLRPGVSAHQAEAELAAAAGDIARARRIESGLRVEVVPGTLLHGSRRAMATTFLGILMALVGLVLLVAASNVANLLLARAIGRRRELAVRVALGAGRARLVVELAVESLLVAGAGGAAGLLAAAWIGSAFSAVTLLPGFELHLALAPDWRVAGVTAALALAAALVATVGPAIAAASSNPVDALKEGGGSIGGRRTAKLRGALVVAQVAVASLACVAALLLAKSGRAAAAVDLGFQTAQTFATDIDLTVRGYSEARGREFYRSLLARMAAVPGVEAAAVASRAPLDSSTPVLRMLPADAPASAHGDAGAETTFQTVSPGYFETIRMDLAAGRLFGAADTEVSPKVAIVNEAFARRFWPQEGPAGAIGKRIREQRTAMSPAQGGAIEIVGVARDAKYRTIGEDAQPHLYLPGEQRYAPDLALIVRSSTTVMPVIETQAVIASLDPEVQGFFTRTLEEHTRVALVPARLAASLSAGVAAISALLGAIGLYGLISCIVAERRREFGLCVALGAAPSAITRQVLARAFRLTALGCLFGLTGAAAASRVLETVLYGVSGTDPFIYLVVALGVLIVSIAAAGLPALRAARAPAVVALRG